ncbi:MAG TPA: GNAT family N-acetyltransferase [Saprospiraceae bacterium]|nr:GNAT family N-acetyltransferase [Saprospiraceae bacterium]
MNEVKLNLDSNGHGYFLIEDGGARIAEMEISISGNELTVYHTEVSPQAQGQGLAKILLDHMASYVRNHGMKVIPLCPYVHAQFKRHPKEYADIWKKERIKA